MLDGRVLALALVGYLGVPLTVAAQSPPPSPQPAAQGDITLDATVHIDRLRYDTTPSSTHMRLSGPHNCAGNYTVKRTNLPAHPKAGVTYRNVTIVMHASASAVKGKGLAACPPR